MTVFPAFLLKEILGLQSWIFLRPRFSSSNLWICRMKKSPYLGGRVSGLDSGPKRFCYLRATLVSAMWIMFLSM